MRSLNPLRLVSALMPGLCLLAGNAAAGVVMVYDYNNTSASQASSSFHNLSGTTLIDETWSNGERSTQDLANNSMAWYSSGPGGNLTATTGSMTQITGIAGRHTLGYFTGAGSPVTLAQGESLILNFTVSFPRGSALGAGNDFRVGLWDSQGQRVSADNHGGTGTTTAISAFSNYAGYIFAGGLDASRSISIRKRNTGTTGILISSTNVYTTLGASQSGHSTLDPNTVYSGVLSITRLVGTEMLIEYSMTNGVDTVAQLSRTDAVDGYISFDTVGFLLGSEMADGFTLSQVELVVVPEPSMTTAFLGAAGLLALLYRRRPRRVS